MCLDDFTAQHQFIENLLELAPVIRRGAELAHDLAPAQAHGGSGASSSTF